MSCPCKELERQQGDGDCKCVHYRQQFPDCHCEGCSVIWWSNGSNSRRKPIQREKMTVYLEPEQIDALDKLRAMSKRPRDRNKEIRGLLWAALLKEPTKVGQAAWDSFSERTEAKGLAK